MVGRLLIKDVIEDTNEYLSELQYALLPAGTEHIIHSFATASETKPDHDMFAMDADNAFNRANKIRGLFEILNHHPSLLPFLRDMYAGDSKAWFYGL